MSHQFHKIPQELLTDCKTSVSDSIWFRFQKEAISWVSDDKLIGEYLMNERKKQNVSLREHAKRLCISAPYLSDLERGNRKWSRDLVGSYIKMLPIEPERPRLLIKGPAKSL